MGSVMLVYVEGNLVSQGVHKGTKGRNMSPYICGKEDEPSGWRKETNKAMTCSWWERKI
jgi:hypothetical protein